MRPARAVVGRSPDLDTADLQETQVLLEVLA